QLRPARRGPHRAGARSQWRDHGRLRGRRRLDHGRARRGLRQARLHAAHLRRGVARRDVRRAPRLRSARAGQSRQGAPAPLLPRMARGGRRMSDAVLSRLRALLGTAGVEREPDGLPRATPDTDEAFAQVCRVASDEGWRIRLEGQGTWLPPDAPADLALSTRALDQVVSVSPADLVATVQAGAPLDQVRRRLADHGMWLALDPPGRPDRSIG